MSHNNNNNNNNNYCKSIHGVKSQQLTQTEIVELLNGSTLNDISITNSLINSTIIQTTDAFFTDIMVNSITSNTSVLPINSNVQVPNIDLNCGTIANVAVLTACNNSLIVNGTLLNGKINNMIIGDVTPSTAVFTDISITNNLNYSTEYLTVDSIVPNVDISINTIISFITISDNNFIGNGTLSNGTVEGQVKKINIISIGTGSSFILSYNLTNFTFTTQGQSLELVWSNNINAWIAI
jgi:hypothetical protein